MANLQAKLQRGDTLKSHEIKLLESYQQGETPEVMAPPVDPSAPDDVLVTTQKRLAEVSGLHENTLGNWKRRGIVPTGGKPWSLTAWFLLLRQHGLLSETKPTSKDAQALRAWCFGNGDAADPNDPAHGAPRGWGEEQSRQGALKTKAARIKEEIDLETLRRERVPIAEYRRRWARRAQLVMAAIEGFMSVTRSMEDLSEAQRVALNAALRAKIRDVRARIGGTAKKGANHARA